MIIKTRAYARAGVLGNPSDGFFGKTISMIVRNFFAEIILYESPTLEILPNQRDTSKFPSLKALEEDVQHYGYYGGIRLIKATIRKFYYYCENLKLHLPDKNFTVDYTTTIPRHVGMAGSSAIITATMRALMQFYGVDIPKEILPNLILEVETRELGIAAGLQDRVIQVYEGLVYMDFSKEIMDRMKHGLYEAMHLSELPNFYMGYRADLSETSDHFHNNIRERWEMNDTAVHKAMTAFAELAFKGKNALIRGDYGTFSALMDRNFDERCKIYRISERNLEIVKCARTIGASAKFSGSGGCIIGIYKDETMYKKLEQGLEKLDVVVFKPVIF
jgi:glucuronokinase